MWTQTNSCGTNWESRATLGGISSGGLGPGHQWTILVCAAALSGILNLNQLYKYKRQHDEERLWQISLRFTSQLPIDATATVAGSETMSPNRYIVASSSHSQSPMSALMQSRVEISSARPQSPFVQGLGGITDRSSPYLCYSPSVCQTPTSIPQQLFLAEFVRGQLEIFAFKRFYQWVRQQLSQLVKRDYAFKNLDQGTSPS